MQKKRIVLIIIGVIAFAIVILVGIIGNSLSNQEADVRREKRYIEIAEQYDIIEECAKIINNVIDEKSKNAKEYLKTNPDVRRR